MSDIPTSPEHTAGETQGDAVTLPTRAGFVALIGEPNAGKSTLLNRMVGAKVSIVTHKVQTTRARIRGVAMAGQSQIVFVDTPGLFEPKRRLDRAMVAAAWGGAADADVVVLLVEANRGLSEGVKRILDRLNEIGDVARVALAINKIDRVEAPVLLGLSQKLNDAYPFIETFMISAEKGHGVEMLKTWLAGEVPESPWLYPEDQIADLPLRMIAAEMTREKLTLRLHQELPYQMTVETEKWEERKDGSARIDQLIYVVRDGHKGIVLGNKGETIKAVGKAAREEMEEFMGRKIHLFLQVKVRPNWLEESERYSEMGLEFKDGNQ
ncbi:GTPase Era [Sulfitobacter guttiformis]|uniref:GTPase Era n=1 Tax=Sulfitobacter guttiformis TaxID=74349 RepID=A0A420DQM4_9RHOB|nr:GTPase Era [Sulfitobacter guttiformis]KIN73949.1 GTPase Era [Sulfitobacter guttiformis KCTC 32187]RKE96576.1 GTP-binding protein Era [Sulfitobacter guttiformis]